MNTAFFFFFFAVAACSVFSATAAGTVTTGFFHCLAGIGFGNTDVVLRGAGFFHFGVGVVVLGGTVDVALEGVAVFFSNRAVNADTDPLVDFFGCVFVTSGDDDDGIAAECVVGAVDALAAFLVVAVCTGDIFFPRVALGTDPGTGFSAAIGDNVGAIVIAAAAGANEDDVSDAVVFLVFVIAGGDVNDS